MTTIREIDNLIYQHVVLPPIATSRAGELQFDGVKPFSKRTEFVPNGAATHPDEHYWLWMRRLPPSPSTTLGTKREPRYEVASTDTEDNPLSYEELFAGSHVDIIYEIRHSVMHEDTDAELLAGLWSKFPAGGISIGGFLVEVDITGPIPENDDNKLGGLFRIVVRDVQFDSIPTGNTVPAITKLPELEETAMSTLEFQGE